VITVRPKPDTTDDVTKREGWQGWDTYAPFYDWENAQTLGRRDVSFWERVASRAEGPVLELGCGTGRVSIPLAPAGVKVVGVDRSAPMLERARKRIRAPRLGTRKGAPAARREVRKNRVRFVRADIRALPFGDGSFPAVIAPYGILQSLIRPSDLTATLASVARVVAPGGTFGIDLVPDVPKWREYSNRVQLRGRAGRSHLTLVESVRQDPKRRLTTFQQTFVERRGERMQKHQFELTFRTLSVAEMSRQLERAGFDVEAVLGDYRGRPWDDRADVWIIMARRRGVAEKRNAPHVRSRKPPAGKRTAP
jgi:ubiquinone/menaquinone biosynthesis C-methylase UbiE